MWHKNCNHRLHGSGSTVVTMTSKVNEKMEISTTCRYETPENIETKFGLNDYVMDPYNPLYYLPCLINSTVHFDLFSYRKQPS